MSIKVALLDLHIFTVVPVKTACHWYATSCSVVLYEHIRRTHCHHLWCPMCY